MIYFNRCAGGRDTPRTCFNGKRTRTTTTRDSRAAGRDWGHTRAQNPGTGIWPKGLVFRLPIRRSRRRRRQSRQPTVSGGGRAHGRRAEEDARTRRREDGCLPWRNSALRAQESQLFGTYVMRWRWDAARERRRAIGSSSSSSSSSGTRWDRRRKYHARARSHTHTHTHTHAQYNIPIMFIFIIIFCCYYYYTCACVLQERTYFINEWYISVPVIIILLQYNIYIYIRIGNTRSAAISLRVPWRGFRCTRDYSNVFDSISILKDAPVEEKLCYRCAYVHSAVTWRGCNGRTPLFRPVKS